MSNIILVCFVSVFLSCSLAAQELTLITENAPPNSYKEHGALTGRTVEIVRAVLKEIDMAGQHIELFPWARGYNMLQNEKNIALFATTRSPQREALFKWAGPIMENQINLYKLKSRKDIKIDQFSDLRKFQVGGTLEDVKSQYLESKGLTLSKVRQEIQNIQKLFSGRVDIIPYASARLSYDVAKSGHDIDGLEQVFYIEEISKQLYVAFSIKTDDAIVEKFQKGFDTIRANGTYQKVADKWK